MARRISKGLSPSLAVAQSVPGTFWGLLVAVVSTAVIATLPVVFPGQLLFLYLPGLLFVSYLVGLLAGIVGAVGSTFLATYFVLQPTGLSRDKVIETAFPTLLFLLSGFLVAVAGSQYRRHQHRSHDDVLRSRWRNDSTDFLSEASKQLASSLDYETTLKNVARIAVSQIADWCVIYLVSEDGAIRQLDVARSGPMKEDVVRELQLRYPSNPNQPHEILLNVLRTGQSEVLPEIPEYLFKSVAQNAEHLDMLRQLELKSAMIVPLIARGKVLGALTFIAAESGRRYGPTDLVFAEELARRAALAVDNARLYLAERTARTEAETAVLRVNAVNRLIALTASSRDLGSVFDEFGRILQSLVPFTRLSVSMHVPETDWLTIRYFTGPRLTAPPESLEGPKAGTARGWVLDQVRGFVRNDTRDTLEFSEDRFLATAGIRSYMVIPMIVGGKPIGTLNFGDQEPASYTDDHIHLAQPIADQLGLMISRLELFDEVTRRAGELSETLQRALLPTDLPTAPFTTIEAVYRPADPEARIGGDWYDALLLPNDTLVLSVGDVTGRGIVSAAAMGQVRHVVRAYATEGRSSAHILQSVNEFLCKLSEYPQLSMWVGTLDPFSGELAYSAAGHPPALLLTSGQTRFLPTTGLPLGISSASQYTEAYDRLDPGTRLIIYTDGLVEMTRDITEGEGRLVQAARSTSNVPSALAVRFLLERVVAGAKPFDDIALLMIDALPSNAPLAFSLAAVPDNLRRLRRVVQAYAARVGIAKEHGDEILLAVGEAALNVVEHAYRGAQGILMVRGNRLGDILTITVSDTGRWRQPRERGRGRGTRIMNALSDSVKTVTGSTGTVVEFTWRLDRARVTRS